MNCIMSLVMLIFWIASGTERLDILIAALVFAALSIPEMYINKKFEESKALKETMNKQFGRLFKKDEN